jgi:hypothetical protein
MTTRRGFRFGGGVLAVPSRTDWVRHVQKAEAQGYAVTAGRAASDPVSESCVG